MVVRVPDERRESQLDLLHDSERNTQRQSALFAGDDDRRLALEGGDEALELELERFTVRSLQLDAIDERRDVGGARPDRGGIEIRLETVVFARPRGEVERQVLALLEDADFSLPLPRDAAGSDVRHRSRRERYAGVGNVQHRR